MSNSVVTRSTELLELIHYDIADLKNTTSRGRKNYYLLFMILLNFTKIYLIETKDEVGSIFFKFKAETEKSVR